MDGAFEASLKGIRLCRDLGLKIGVRFTMTQDNAHDLPELLKLVEDEGIDRFYFSHLNYAGRGNKNRKDDAQHKLTRWAMDLLFDTCWEYQQRGLEKEFTTGNNDADGVYFLHWVRRRFPEQAAHVEAKLRQWGGNSSGVNVANIDNLGNVHPDTMWWHHTPGQRQGAAVLAIWPDTSDPLMAGLKQYPRTVKGRCGECAYLEICNGNTRVRAQQMTGDPGRKIRAVISTTRKSALNLANPDPGRLCLPIFLFGMAATGRSGRCRTQAFQAALRFLPRRDRLGGLGPALIAGKPRPPAQAGSLQSHP
jgi:radical SAM protein with 4Fe4S-binding SPASM domain